MKRLSAVLIAITVASCSSNAPDQPSDGVMPEITGYFVFNDEVRLIGSKNGTGTILDTVQITFESGKYRIHQSGVRESLQRDGSISKIRLLEPEFIADYDKEQRRLTNSTVTKDIQIDNEGNLFFTSDPKKVYQRVFH